MSDYDLDVIDRLRLIRTEHIGPKTYRQLLHLHKTPAHALDYVQDMAMAVGRKKPIKICPKSQAEEELTKVAEYGARMVFLGEPDYPEILSHISDAPIVLTIMGSVDILQRNMIAIVGARNASIHGKSLAETFAKEIGKKGFIVASGLARGIDAAAHSGSVATGTVAVLAGGINYIYPKEHDKLYKNIIENGGAIIAESPFGAVPRAESFPRRNRIISGLSLGVLVVEAAMRSGSLITARMAAEQGREVFAVPGFPMDPRSEGPNKLLKDGATLAENVDDVIDGCTENKTRYNQVKTQDNFFTENVEEIIWEERASIDAGEDVDNQEISEVNDIRENIVKILGKTPVEVDDISYESGAPVQKVLGILLELELAGRLIRHPGNKVSLAA